MTWNTTPSYAMFWHRPRLAAREPLQSNRGASLGGCRWPCRRPFAANVLPVVRDLQAAGVMTVRALTEPLGLHGIRTARGGEWYGSIVRNLLARRLTTELIVLRSFRFVQYDRTKHYLLTNAVTKRWSAVADESATSPVR